MIIFDTLFEETIKTNDYIKKIKIALFGAKKCS